MNNLIKQIVESKFNFNIDIEDNERLNLLSKSTYKSKSQKELYLDYYVVDLGLPSGTIWCRYNLGVDINLLDNVKDWYGDYYAWGEIEPKNAYSEDNYKYGKNYELTKYCNKKQYGHKQYVDELKTLLLEDDAAYLNIHIGNLKFRIPSKDLFNELLLNTLIVWVENYNDINGLNGRKFKSKINDNEMFIPFTGFRSLKLIDDCVVANLWSIDLNIEYPYGAWYLYLDGNDADINYDERYYGFPIRPVLLQ